MMNINDILNKWLTQLNDFEFQNYEKLPDIDLYMDQVVTYLEKQLQIFQTTSLDKQITSSMINNYVKGEVISSPIAKKYNREHLSLIEEVCALKQVLSIAEIKQVLQSNYTNKNHMDVFNEFKNLHAKENQEAVTIAKETLEKIEVNDIDSLNNLALEMAIKANAFITISKRILFLTKHLNEEKNNE